MSLIYFCYVKHSALSVNKSSLVSLVRLYRLLGMTHLDRKCFFDKALAVDIPVWVGSLGLSKVFARVQWPALWKNLLEQGSSEHMVWMIWELYAGQCGKSPDRHVEAENSTSLAACGKDVF